MPHKCTASLEFLVLHFQIMVKSISSVYFPKSYILWDLKGPLNNISLKQLSSFVSNLLVISKKWQTLNFELKIDANFEFNIYWNVRKSHPTEIHFSRVWKTWKSRGIKSRGFYWESPKWIFIYIKYLKHFLLRLDYLLCASKVQNCRVNMLGNFWKFCLAKPEKENIPTKFEQPWISNFMKIGDLMIMIRANFSERLTSLFSSLHKQRYIGLF